MGNDNDIPELAFPGDHECLCLFFINQYHSVTVSLNTLREDEGLPRVFF